MKLVFYGGGDIEQNFTLDQSLFGMINNKQPKMTFIPACSYHSEIEFVDFIRQYAQFNVKRFIHFPVDVEFDQILLREVFTSDVIHLGGGNTFYFLKYLRKKKLFPLLKKFVDGGGVLTGLSAGAIMMTPTITTASFPSFDFDENIENLRDLKSLNFVKFHFFPHYVNSNRYAKELAEFSKTIDMPLFAAPDGAGVIVQNNELQFVGRVHCFHNGKKTLVSR
jgi:dipeptidase E